MNLDPLVLGNLVISAGAVGFAIFVYVSLSRRIDLSSPSRSRSHNQSMAEIASLKRELALLSDTVTRVRSQNALGSSESLAEQERILKESINADVKREIGNLSNDFDKAIKQVVERFDRRQTELLRDLESISQIGPLRDEINRIKMEVGQALSNVAMPPAQTQDLSALHRTTVHDRFIASLENPEDRRKCIISSLDSVLDIPTLGKLAVAYPSVNSWLMLQELADHGVVSDIAGWALLAGAELSRGKDDLKLAEKLYQSARLSFSIGGTEDHEGLYFVSHGLASVLNQTGREEVAMALLAGANNNLAMIQSSNAPEPAKDCKSLADYYLEDERHACAAILYMRVLNVCDMMGGHEALADQSWNGLARCLRSIVMNSVTKVAAEREYFRYFGREVVTFLSRGLNRPDSLVKEDSEKEGILLCMLRLCERDKDTSNALATIVSLMHQVESSRVSKDHKSFLASEVLFSLDEMGLSKKAVGLPILKQLVEIFSRSGNANKAASAGAKLVDVSLDLFGDASLETVGPIELLARVYRSMERYDLAEECYRQILEVQYKVYPSEHENMIDVLLNLAETCLIQHDDGEGEIFIESAQEMASHLLATDESAEAQEKLARINERVSRLKGLMPAGAS